MSSEPSKGRKYIAAWLYLISFLVFAMVVLGGLTRLTGSGLSMVDWRLIMGAIPPLHEGDWLRVFEQYQQFPEYKIHNSAMTLAEFKFIFFMEYAHRLLGRLIGLVFLVPFIFFWAKHWLTAKQIRQYGLLFFLGGLQGLVGWYMVKSGLVDVPRVSQYRLVMHLLLALMVVSLSLWFAFSLAPAPRAEEAPPTGFKAHIAAILVLLAMQITGGGFVAGLRAGFIFNSFPTMNGQWIPDGLWLHHPWYLNFFENPVTAQFLHRNLAYGVAILIVTLYLRFLKKPLSIRFRRGLHATALLLTLQISLGILTLIYRVPVALASAHQAVAVLLLAAVLFLCHQAYQPPGAETRTAV